uniref:Uncharacterized protein n=1 Tax=Arundo donax TaxID=35708 RepID=A0A0A9FKJ4_ARUDO
MVCKPPSSTATPRASPVSSSPITREISCTRNREAIKSNGDLQIS